MGFDLTPGALAAALLVSSLGAGYFLYGRKQRRAPQLLAGLVMMIAPMLLTSPWAILGSGVLAIGGVALALRAGW